MAYKVFPDSSAAKGAEGPGGEGVRRGDRARPPHEGRALVGLAGAAVASRAAPGARSARAARGGSRAGHAARRRRAAGGAVTRGGQAQVLARRGDEAGGDLRERGGEGGRIAGERRRARVGGELAVARERQRAEAAEPTEGEGGHPASWSSQNPPRARAGRRHRAAPPPDRRRSSCGGVALGDVRQLVREHALELGRLQALQQPLGHMQLRPVAPEADHPAVGLALTLEHEPRLG